MRLLHLFMASILVIPVFTLQAQQDEHIIVITQLDTQLNNVNKTMLRNLYMGNLGLGDITPIALAPGELARSVFNVRVVGLTESRIQAYWAQMRFSGRKQRPIEASDPAEAILMVQSTVNTIAYVPAGTVLPKDVKIIFTSQTPQ
ncbi:hypothetical protein [Alteromonas sp. AMM-1]|uniref:hypothetical protein n=1 Tax=Alteromonas sp. AMM-1 TaxID=3394233 RepID=UPI0039A57B4D